MVGVEQTYNSAGDAGSDGPVCFFTLFNPFFRLFLPGNITTYFGGSYYLSGGVPYRGNRKGNSNDFSIFPYSFSLKMIDSFSFTDFCHYFIFFISEGSRD